MSSARQPRAGRLAGRETHGNKPERASVFTFETDLSSSQTKQQQLIHAITQAISSGVLREGDSLPSVNKLSRQSGLSRDTVFKVYSILKQRSIVSSTAAMGYFVSSVSFRVMMLLDDFSAFKEQLYTNFRNNLPDNYSVDLLFHHCNQDVFEQLILNSLGRYSMYVVMNINNGPIGKVVKKIGADKLLILDMGTPDSDDMAFITQDFTQGAVDCLQESLPHVRRYDEFHLVFPENTEHPMELTEAFSRFCRLNGLKYSVEKKIGTHSIKKGMAFLVVKEADLVYIIKQCGEKGLKPGTDVGLISYNDTPMKEIAGPGITTISVDFGEMGRKAASFVESKEKVFDILKPRLTLRGSL